MAVWRVREGPGWGWNLVCISVYPDDTHVHVRIRLAGDSIHNVGGAWACQGGSRDGVKSSQVKNVKSLQYINLRVDFFCS